MESNIQCQRILEGVERLEIYLQEKIAKEALDLDSNFETTRNQELLVRLKKSLLQYAERGKNLSYIGFMGHFSAGKSSTINSLLGLGEGSKEARTVGLNPIDRNITLITHSENRDSVFSTTREGLVPIRANFIDSPFLENIVIADTPGTGDPVLASEIAQDFLPICDLIIYFFSAAIPLDSADVPLLKEKSSNLAFIPIQFVVTRADEFKEDLGAPFSDKNFDRSRADAFLDELSTRLSNLFSNSHYIEPQQIILINNKPQFNIEDLKQVVLKFTNSSNLDSQINIHSHKIIYFQSSAEKLKEFFCRFLLNKLRTLTQIIDSSQANIDRFRNTIRLSNSDLIQSWNDKNYSILSEKYSIAKQLTEPSETPSSIDSFCSKFSKLNSLGYRWKDEFDQRYELINDSIKKNISLQLKEYADPGKRKINNLSSLSDLDKKIEEYKLSFNGLRKEKIFSSVDFSPSPILYSESLRVCDDATKELRNQYKELKGALGNLKLIVGDQRPLRKCQSILNSAIEDLHRDFNNYFESITVYRTGVFALNVKEAISKLGLGQQMDILESKELTDIQKKTIQQSALDHIFPGIAQSIMSFSREISNLQIRIEELQKKIISRASSASTSTSNELLEDWKKSQLALIKNGLVNEIDLSIAQLEQNINIRIRSIFSDFLNDWENEVDRMKRDRKQRLITLTLSFGFAGLILYIIYILGAKIDLANNLFIAFTFGIFVNLVSNGVGFIWAKITDKFPINIKIRETRLLSQLRDNYAQTVDDSLNNFDTSYILDSQIIHEYWKNLLLIEPLRLWSTKNEVFYNELKEFSDEYATLRQEYLNVVNSIVEIASSYFENTENNLEKLNGFLDDLQQTAIKPSFELLAHTKENLDLVIQNIQTIDFT